MLECGNHLEQVYYTSVTKLPKKSRDGGGHAAGMAEGRLATSIDSSA